MRLGRGAKIAGGVVAALVIGVLLLEWTVLRGEQVARLTVGLGPSDSEKIVIDRVGEEHLFEVDTRRRRGGKNEGRPVKIRLVDPNGEVVYESGEWVARKERFFSFTPKVAGTYEISIRPDELLGGSSWGSRTWGCSSTTTACCRGSRLRCRSDHRRTASSGLKSLAELGGVHPRAACSGRTSTRTQNEHSA